MPYDSTADGAKDNRTFLEEHTERQLLDFYHVTEYLAKASYAVYPKRQWKFNVKIWLSELCLQLKHEKKCGTNYFGELNAFTARKLSKSVKDDLESTLI